MTDKCRQEFEKWYRANHDGYNMAKSANGKYRSTCEQWAWVGWEAARKAPSSPVNRDDWLTEEEIDDIRVAMFNWHPVPPDVLSKALDMAASAISLHAERAALFSQLRAAIDTTEMGNV